MQQQLAHFELVGLLKVLVWSLNWFLIFLSSVVIPDYFDPSVDVFDEIIQQFKDISADDIDLELNDTILSMASSSIEILDDEEV